MVMRDTRLEVPYQAPEEESLLDSIGRGLREAFVRDQKKYPTSGRRVDFSGVSQRDRERMAAEQKKRDAQNPAPAPKKREQSSMGSNKNINVGTGRGETTFGPSKTPAKPSIKPPVTRKPAGEYVAPSSVESALTAGIQGLPGGQSGVSQEAGSDYGRTTYFGETPEAATQVAQQMRKGLFGEDISQEDYEAMTQRNKDASFYGRFKKGGQVKKKTAKKASGGSVSSASKRGDGCCQRGKTKGRMV
jgi:hypothetical protein